MTNLLTQPPVSETPTLRCGSSNANTWHIGEAGYPPPSDEMEILGGLFLGDASNTFNSLSVLVMLWIVRHQWPGGARFSFNCYIHSVQLLIRRPGEVDPETLFIH